MNGLEAPTRRKTKVGVIIVTTVISIGITLAAAWFTIKRSEKQATLVEAERARSIKNNLLSIVEEHIINQKPMDRLRLIRLIEFQSRKEKIVTKIAARELIGEAEYNILTSRYLDFKQKEDYKAIFNQLYKEMIPEDYSPFKDMPHAELLNELARHIQEGKTEDSLKLLNQYVENLNAELTALEKKTIPRKSAIEIFRLFRNRTFYAIMIVYIVALVFLFYSRRIRGFIARRL